MLPHTLRIEGAVFLILMAQCSLPAVFALPGGLGDIAAEIFAPFIARRLARRSGAIRFHLLGVAGLVIALSIGFLAGLGPVQVFYGAASTLPLSQLPLALIPTVAVPTAITLPLSRSCNSAAMHPRTFGGRARPPRPAPLRPDPGPDSGSGTDASLANRPGFALSHRSVSVVFNPRVAGRGACCTNNEPRADGIATVGGIQIYELYERATSGHRM